MNANPNDRRTTLVQQQALEIQLLRKQLEGLKSGKVPVAVVAAPVAGERGPTVEQKPVDLRALVALRNLLVACENFAGPEAGQKPTALPKELADAMKAAAVYVRKEKKP